ncbi:MAG: HEAT repeat domain-containing protein [Microbacteriaceae bacterium]
MTSTPASSSADIPIDASPADRIALAVTTLGEEEVVDRAKALLAGLNAGDEFLLWVGGKHAQGILDGAPPLYWPEVWAARALLHVWNDTAAPGIEAGLSNQAWRVREMCARVSLMRSLPVAEALRPLLTDDTARVRAQAARALAEIGDVSDADSLTKLFRDPEIEVRRAAQQSHKRLVARTAEVVEPSAE